MMNKRDYPENWKEISLAIRERAKNKCELCGALNGETTARRTKVVLTVHHIDRDKKNNKAVNLIAICQKCHLRLDLEHHIENSKRTRLEKTGKRLLPFG